MLSWICLQKGRDFWRNGYSHGYFKILYNSAKWLSNLFEKSIVPFCPEKFLMDVKIHLFVCFFVILLTVAR